MLNLDIILTYKDYLIETLYNIGYSQDEIYSIFVINKINSIRSKYNNIKRDLSEKEMLNLFIDIQDALDSALQDKNITNNRFSMSIKDNIELYKRKSDMEKNL